MINPKIPINEKERQEAVNKYKDLKDLNQESYDNITKLIATICEVPVSMISLLDYDVNLYKSKFGLPVNYGTRDESFCGHAILNDDPITIVHDSRIDERFHDNPFVLNGSAIFYAGVPLISIDGQKLGTLCVYDVKPRNLSESQINALKILAKQVMILFEKEYQSEVMKDLQKKLKIRNEDLEKFAGIVSHDLKSPLANIISLTQLLEEENEGKLTDDSLLYLNYLKVSSFTLRNYIDGILNFYKSDSFLNAKKEIVDVNLLLQDLRKMTLLDDNAIIEANIQLETITTNKAALQQVLLNLISNAIKYNSKTTKIVTVELTENKDYLLFSVSDNGNGILEKDFEKIFDLFQTIDNEDVDVEKGSGIGLATVKKVVKSLGGTISVTSKIGEGSVFEFSILK